MIADRDDYTQEGIWRPGRLWSLWDMLRFHADKFMSVLNILSNVESLLMGNAFFKVPTNAPFVASQLETLIDLLRDLRLPVSVKKAEEIHLIMTDMANEAMTQLVKRKCEDLRNRIEDELEGRALYVVYSNVELLEGPALFGAAVDKAFPSARHDIAEAGKCLAFRRSTACVIHLMRTLEVGLACLADALGLHLTTENWNTILNEVENEIRSRTKATHGDEWKDVQEPYFAEAATHFRLVKNAWRNHAVHARVKYTDEEAEDIYQSVRAFMRHLAKRLAEPSPPSVNALAR